MKAFMNWSGGKDSALALLNAQRQGVPVEALVTTVNATLNRISIHGVRCELLQQQAKALGLPLYIIELPDMPAMAVYEEAMREMHRQLKREGFTHGVFGDIFLEDLKQYRQNLLAKDGLHCLFPLWNRDSREVVTQFLRLGFRAVVVCVDSRDLDSRFCGRLMNERFFNDLPAGVDCCGENGEYHSFVFEAPNFSAPVPFQTGKMVFRKYPAPKRGNDGFAAPQSASGFYFCDLLPVEAT